MNRKQFFKLFAAGAAAAVVAPQLLVPKEEVTVIGVKEMLAMQESIMNSIVNMPMSQWGGWWYFEQESLALARMQANIEMAFLFGEKKKRLRKSRWIISS